MALFGTSKGSEQPMAKQGNTVAPTQVNIIAEGTVFEGTLQAESDVRVSGRIIGKLKVQGRAVVAPEGAIEGEVVATNATIAGTVQGDLLVEERLMLSSTARVEGTIKTGRLIVEDAVLPGSNLIVTLTMVTVGLSIYAHGATSWFGSESYGRWHQRQQKGEQPADQPAGNNKPEPG